MRKKLVIIGGFVNLILLIFHIYLGFTIANFKNLLPEHLILMQMLNVGGVGLVAFFTYVSFFCKMELIETKLGKVVFGLIFLTYFIRALEEFIFFGKNLNLPVLGSCLLVSILYLYILNYKKIKSMNRRFKFLFGFFISCLIGYFAVGSSWLRYIFAHLGGLAIIGIVAWWGGKIVQKKSYGFKKVFWWTFLLPIFLGIIGVLMVITFGRGGCGGIVSLTVIVMMVVFYQFILPDKRDSIREL